MLIQCPECSREVSDNAASCPNCGYALTEADKAKAKEKAMAEQARSEREAREAAAKAEADQSNKKIGSFIKYGIGLLVVIFMWRACSSASDSKESAPICSSSDAWLYAQQAVEGVLKNPDEADFHNPLGWEVKNDATVAGQYIVTGEVTATNSFNAKIRQTFKAVVRCDKGTWYIGNVTMQ
jgi:uncharacterized Zn finger protein (UPF0148 family)